MKTHSIFLTVFALAASTMLYAQNVHEFVVRTDKPGAEIQPTMYGLFFEDINYAADGGLYAELIKNRSFEFPQPFMGWNTFGNVLLQEDGPFEQNPHYVRIGDAGHAEKHSGIENEGFFGIGVQEGATYRFSVWARGKNQKLRIELVKNNTMEEHQAFASAELTVTSDEWKPYELLLESPCTEPKARLRIFLVSQGTVDVEHVSLFPTDTWQGRRNGLRKDLVQALYDIRPGVLRFPGGCIVEGADEATRYEWKKTVGPVENRPLNENRWHYTFTYRFFPDYFQSGGLGFFEYFQLAEDIGAEPLPIVNCGLICQYQNEPEHQIPLTEIDGFIQDALDLIEFANGDPATTWGKVRADMGHPEPFHLKYLGIGNEQWGPEYPARLERFRDVLRKAHPEINLVGGAGPNAEGEDFDYLWPEMKRLEVDLVDEHFYRPESWFLAQGNRYDKYDRKGPKVFAGEYACHGKGKKWNHFYAALMEAAFMTGLERNADVVQMATYAPLFAHVEGWQWRPDLIWFDNLHTVRTCSYYVQQLYSLNKGTNVLPLTMNKQSVSGQEGQDGLFASAVWDNDEQAYIVKIANTSDASQPISLVFAGLKKNETLTEGTCLIFHSEDPDKDNTIENPDAVVPQKSPVVIDENGLETEIAPYTFVVYRFAKTCGDSMRL